MGRLRRKGWKMGTLTYFAYFVRSVTQQVSETGERPHFSGAWHHHGDFVTR
jgi:hypothetical protein